VPIAAVLARYRELEAEHVTLRAQVAAGHALSRNLLSRLIAMTDARDALATEIVRLHEACDRIARAGMHEVDARELGY
jgi:hypothetical protein